MEYGFIILGAWLVGLTIFMIIGDRMATQFQLSMGPMDYFYASVFSALVFTVAAVGGYWTSTVLSPVLELIVQVVSVTAGYAAGYLLLQAMILGTVRGTR